MVWGSYDSVKDKNDRSSAKNVPFLSPPVLMHGGLLCVAFLLSVCLSVTRK